MDKLLHHYELELGRLRHATRQYAEDHPETAAALELGPDASTDPEVERLLQSVALLNASMQQSIEENRGDFHRALLQTLQPHYLQTIPSRGIVQIDTSSARANEISTVSELPRGSVLRAGEHKFTTAYNTSVTPFAVSSAKFQSTINLPTTLRLPSNATSALIITIESTAGSASFDKPARPKLRIFIDGTPELRSALLDAILMRSLCVCLEVNTTWLLLDQSPFTPAGYTEEESLLPHQPGPQSQRLLTELFQLPEKFSFIDLDLAAISALCPQGCSKITLHIVLPACTPYIRQASARNFQLACTPVINIFPQSAEAIRLDGRSEAYPLTPMKPGCDIYSVEHVAALNKDGDKTFPPFRGTEHTAPGPYWQIEHQEGFALKFVDREQRPVKMETGSVTAQLKCTNSEILHQPCELISEVSVGNFPIQFLHAPGASSHISDPGFLCEAFFSEATSLPSLCNLLQLHGCKYTACLKGLVAKPSTTWLQHPMGRMHMHGTEFTLIVDEPALREHSIHTLAELLARALADKLRENRFAQLRVANGDGQVLCQTSPRVGSRRLA
ncbi:type VI secretion system baseplate subunit TssF [Pseudoduganella sp. OTU4001]|uniref:type VI secretion system baseplate subunit TssF n=1 Tax=Pseudoduganella sp. OTU4001 TaxID=3043854 RepID=UPI00313B296E